MSKKYLEMHDILVNEEAVYALEEALTTYGLIGVKVWINRGEVFKKNFSSSVNKPKKQMDRKHNERKFSDSRSSRDTSRKEHSRSSKPQTASNN